MKKYEFYSKIVGSTFCDGQQIIKQMSVDDEVILKSEPNNKFDENAIMVLYKDQKVGYLPRETAKSLKEDMLKSEDPFWSSLRIKAHVSDLTGGEGSKENVGCNIHIVVGEVE